jgi:hypothetical protein
MRAQEAANHYLQIIKAAFWQPTTCPDKKQNSSISPSLADGDKPS